MNMSDGFTPFALSAGPVAPVPSASRAAAEVVGGGGFGSILDAAAALSPVAPGNAISADLLQPVSPDTKDGSDMHLQKKDADTLEQPERLDPSVAVEAAAVLQLVSPPPPSAPASPAPPVVPEPFAMVPASDGRGPPAPRPEAPAPAADTRHLAEPVSQLAQPLSSRASDAPSASLPAGRAGLPPPPDHTAADPARAVVNVDRGAAAVPGAVTASGTSAGGGQQAGNNGTPKASPQDAGLPSAASASGIMGQSSPVLGMPDPAQAERLAGSLPALAQSLSRQLAGAVALLPASGGSHSLQLRPQALGQLELRWAGEGGSTLVLAVPQGATRALFARLAPLMRDQLSQMVATPGLRLELQVLEPPMSGQPPVAAVAHAGVAATSSGQTEGRAETRLPAGELAAGPSTGRPDAGASHGQRHSGGHAAETRLHPIVADRPAVNLAEDPATVVPAARQPGRGWTA